MAQIRFIWYYTQLVEHYLRMAVRYDRVDKNTPRDWFQFTKTWVEMQSNEDKELIYFVFGKQFFNTIEGLYCYERDTPMFKKRERLAVLERQFAIDGGLIGDESEQTQKGKSKNK